MIDTVAVYVKNGIPCKRRTDLELINIEWLWVEVKVRNKRVLVGTFYRPPNSFPLVLTDIENCIHVGMAADIGISDIVILGDFNLNMLNAQSQRKITDLCQKYNFSQLINEPTNYTESSASIIALIMVSNLHSVDISGVGEPLLMQDIRYHCPTFWIFKFKRHVVKPFSRKIWLYDHGNYDNLRQKISEFKWDSVYNDDVNEYAKHFSDTLISIDEQCIPTKNVTIRPRDLPWINNNIRRLMRKRNRLYKKYKKNRNISIYDNFKQARNEITSNLRKAKEDYTESLENKLKTSNSSSQDYWKTLKSFIKPSHTVTIPPLFHENNYVAESDGKASLLNSYFVEQTVLDDHLASLPESVDRDSPTLNNIVVSPTEVEDILNTSKLGKATGR